MILDFGFWILVPCNLKIYFMSYKKLQIWQLAKELTTEVHAMSLRLPKFEQFEEAQQIRRSIKSVRSNIVEGYGRRYYKQEFIRFIIYSLSSNDETIDHLEVLFETKSLDDEKLYNGLHEKLEVLGKKLNNFLQSLERLHSKPDNALRTKSVSDSKHSESGMQHPESNNQNPATIIQVPESNIKNPESSI